MDPQRENQGFRAIFWLIIATIGIVVFMVPVGFVLVLISGGI